RLIALGAPYVRPRTSSDYWLYAELFANTCPVAIDADEIVGVLLAMRSQVSPDDVYIQDVATHPGHRRRGIARLLLGHVYDQAAAWACRRMYLTSEPDNHIAHTTWLAVGFDNLPGDQTIEGVSVISHYKGPGKHRAVYQRIIRFDLPD